MADPTQRMMSLPPAGARSRMLLVPTYPPLPGNVTVTLENQDMWREFHEIGTEMIITKGGR